MPPVVRSHGTRREISCGASGPRESRLLVSVVNMPRRWRATAEVRRNTSKLRESLIKFFAYLPQQSPHLFRSHRLAMVVATAYPCLRISPPWVIAHQIRCRVRSVRCFCLLRSKFCDSQHALRTSVFPREVAHRRCGIVNHRRWIPPPQYSSKHIPICFLFLLHPRRSSAQNVQNRVTEIASSFAGCLL